MSEMSLTQAATEVRKLTRGIKAVAMIEEALDKVASLEQQDSALTQAIAEKEQALKALTEEAVALRAELDQEEKDSIARSDAHIAETAQKASQIVQEATAKVQAGLDTLAEREQEFNGAKAILDADLETLQAQIATAQEELATIIKKTDDAKKKLSAFIES